MTSPEPLALPGLEPFTPDLAAQLRDALREQGDDYVPRTHHVTATGAPRYINRLILETSPYLLQHAHNPVSWWPWSDAAFTEAERLDRPVLLSVGYSTCHWCHVMERESFEDEEIAAYINANFIPIKVDREERPDVDSVYMTVVQLMTGGGGWPMTVVMLPDRRPYFGGTYFPPRDGDRGARVGFLTVLKRLRAAYDEERERVVESARRVSSALAEATRPRPPQGMPTESALVEAARWLTKRYDPEHGGFGSAPKFPRPSTHELLLRYHRRTGDPLALAMVEHSVRAMCDGGIYDHIGGGFARYSTDAQWLVPHFEKMLYDNAQLLSLLVETYQATDDPRFAEVARETADYVLREMTDHRGGFFSATDADSEGEEGRFFVWSKGEIESLLPPEQARLFVDFYGVTESGNFEGRNVLHRTRSLEDFAAEIGEPIAQVRESLAAARERLYQAREARVHPLLDDKILTEWNGQMIAALARAGFALDEPRYVEAAENAASFIDHALTREDGELLRSFRDGRARHDAVLEDYAFYIDGLIALFEATGRTRWLDLALRHQTRQDQAFWDDGGGGYFGTADDAEALIVRPKPEYDGAQPSGNSVAALNLVRLATLTQREDIARRAEAILLAFGTSLSQGAIENPKMAQALDFYLDQPLEIVIVEGNTTAPGLMERLRTTFVPNRVLIRVKPGDADVAERIPLAAGKTARDGETTVYVCRDRVCDRPATDGDQLQGQLTAKSRIEAPPLALR
jgi:hypothetical protein